MDYEPYDSSGTDDDLPPSHQNRIPRGGCVAGNGRPAVMGSVPYPRMYGEIDMEAQIHHLEQEAYRFSDCPMKCIFLREKESLITELRKELRLSNEEHRELLGRVNAGSGDRRVAINLACFVLAKLFTIQCPLPLSQHLARNRRYPNPYHLNPLADHLLLSTHKQWLLPINHLLQLQNEDPL